LESHSPLPNFSGLSALEFTIREVPVTPCPQFKIVLFGCLLSKLMHVQN
jgi:hypothetical protein